MTKNFCGLVNTITFHQMGKEGAEERLEELKDVYEQLYCALDDYISFKQLQSEITESKGSDVVAMDHPAMSMADMSKFL